MKNLRRSPARTSASRRVLARVVEPKPATRLACSRSMMRITASSVSRCRSRSWRTIPRRLFPVMERLFAGATDDRLAAPNLFFDVLAIARPARTAAGEKIRRIDLRFVEDRHHGFRPPLMPGLHHHVAAREILQKLHERLSAIERPGDLLGIKA